MTSLSADNKQMKKAYLKDNPRGLQGDAHNFDYRKKFKDFAKGRDIKPVSDGKMPTSDPREFDYRKKYADHIKAQPNSRQTSAPRHTFGQVMNKTKVAEEMVAANAVQGGNVAGLGGENGEPGVDKKKKKKVVMKAITSRTKP